MKILFIQIRLVIIMYKCWPGLIDFGKSTFGQNEEEILMIK